MSDDERWERPRIHRILRDGDPEPWDMATFDQKANGLTEVLLERRGRRCRIPAATVVKTRLTPLDLEARNIKPLPNTDYWEIVVSEADGLAKERS